jgi:hypothetical protein
MWKWRLINFPPNCITCQRHVEPTAAAGVVIFNAAERASIALAALFCVSCESPQRVRAGIHRICLEYFPGCVVKIREEKLSVMSNGSEN